MDQLNELGFYGLPGAPKSPAELLPQCRDGEALGLGSVFLSERFNIKEVVTLSGAAGAVSESLGIATGVTNHNTRHPIVTASFATTMHPSPAAASRWAWVVASMRSSRRSVCPRLRPRSWRTSPA